MLNVVFDTNAIFNKEFDSLTCQAAKDLIGRHSNHGDLGIRWVVPEIVRGEREYQMRNEYREISSHLEKAESLFGQQWGITQNVVEERIAARISGELTGHRIEVVPCDIARVDWVSVMRRSCFREPPFQRGPTEKGFRDAIVCETFIQLASDLAGGDTAVLVSNDRLIKQYIDSCEVEGSRARVVEDLKALDDEIQLRVANVDQETQAFIERRAQQLFFPFDNREDPTCLWAREQIYQRIWAEHGDRLRAVPQGFDYVFVAHELSPARLVSKEGPRVHFQSTYSVQSAFRFWAPAANMGQETATTTLASLLGTAQGLPDANNKLSQGGLSGLLGVPAAGEWKQIPKDAKDTISIDWSATFSRRRTLTHSTIDAINFAV
jgi:hypothetical protein